MYLIDECSTAFDLVRIVRTAQGISQQSVSLDIGVSQSAVAQYEKRKHTLSRENLRELAPLVNLDPDFLSWKYVNPFKQANSNEPIQCMLSLSTERPEQINFSLIKIIAKHNVKVDVVLLKIPEAAASSSRRIDKQLRNGHTVCAFALKDTRGNIFLFRQKEKLSFFTEEDITNILKFISYDLGSYFFISSVEISLDLFQKITQWSKIATNTLLPFFPKIEKKESVEFVLGLVNTIYAFPSGVNKTDEKNALISNIEKAGEQYYSHIMPWLIDKIKKVIQESTVPQRERF